MVPLPRCPACHGDGVIRVYLDIPDLAVYAEGPPKRPDPPAIRACPDCNGTGTRP